MLNSFRWAVLFAVLVLAACSGSTDRSGEPQYTYYRDAKAILDEKCVTCHNKQGIGPMPLASYKDAKPFLPAIEAAVADGIMPPWIANAPYKYYQTERRLTAQEKSVLLDWIRQDDGAEGDAEEAPPPVEPVIRSLDRVDLSLASEEPYRAQIEPDDYRCFVLPWPYETTKYITGVDLVPEERKVVHHIVLYQVDPANAQAAMAKDAEEEGPGYTCFATAGVTAAWLTSYEPGGYAEPLPDGVGLEVLPGTVMILQVHYNTYNGIEADRSRAEFTVEDDVKRVGRVLLFMEPAWPAGNMQIPAGAADAAHSWHGRPTLWNDQTLEVFTADLHMHMLGSSGRIGIIRKEAPGMADLLLDIPRWDFHWQETYRLRESERLLPGDELYLECHWDNRAERQIVVDGEKLPERDVNWGDGTRDEMCLGNVLVAPL